MTCDWLIPCEDIKEHPSGGHSILGIFGRMTVDKLPGDFGPVAVAFRLSGAPHEVAAWTVEVIEPDGKVMGRAEPAAPVALSVYGFLDGMANLTPLHLRIPGLHRIRLLLDGKVAKEIALPVVRMA